MRTSLVLLLAVAMLAACTTVTPRPGQQPSEMLAGWQETRARLAKIERWDLRGRMAVRTADDGGSATFAWDRAGDNHRIEMFGPFGSGRVSINQGPEGAELRDGDNPPRTAPTAEELLYYQVGWHVPFESLKFWLKGMPSPGPHDGLILDSEGRALAFRQDGWDVSIVDYELVDSLSLPRKVFIKALPGTVHLVGDGGEDLGDRLDVKVVIRSWLLPSG
jgi:outer membrane lipoprotein LolB